MLGYIGAFFENLNHSETSAPSNWGHLGGPLPERKVLRYMGVTNTITPVLATREVAPGKMKSAIRFLSIFPPFWRYMAGMNPQIGLYWGVSDNTERNDSAEPSNWGHFD